LAEKLREFGGFLWVGVVCGEALGKELDNMQLIVGGKLKELLFEFLDNHDEVKWG
jgi:hypothetical protein